MLLLVPAAAVPAPPGPVTCVLVPVVAMVVPPCGPTVVVAAPLFWVVVAPDGDVVVVLVWVAVPFVPVAVVVVVEVTGTAWLAA